MPLSSLSATKALTILKRIAAIKTNALEKTNNLGVFVRVKGVMTMTHVKIPIELLNDIDRAAINTQKYLDGTFDNTSSS